MKRGLRVVHGEKELIEKLGRNDPCPCGSGRRFQGVLSQDAPVSSTRTITLADETLRSMAEPSSHKGSGGGSIPPGATSLLFGAAIAFSCLALVSQQRGSSSEAELLGAIEDVAGSTPACRSNTRV